MSDSLHGPQTSGSGEADSLEALAPVPELLSWRDCGQLDAAEVQRLYRNHVNSGQVDLIGSFGFGRTVVHRAEGMYLFTDDGRKILDFTGGVGVLSHGHNHPRILAARTEFQKQQRMEVHKNFLCQYVAGLSHNIAQLLPGDLDISFFCNSGAEAVEGALKLAYKSFDGKRKYVLHSDISFHGKLLGAGSLTASPEIHFAFPRIPHVRAFRYNDLESVEDLLRTLRTDSGECDVYAVIVEPMSASSLRQCSEEFLTGLRRLCDAHGVVLIFDEVYTCWGMTGHLFHFMKCNVVPDVVTMSKSFGGGKSSISGYTSRRVIFERAYGDLKNALLHGTTYNAFGEECATAMEAIQVIVDDDYVGRARHIHDRVQQGLRRAQQKHPELIEEVRGSGTLNGVIMTQTVNRMIQGALRFVPSQVLQDNRLTAKLILGSVISEMYNSHDILSFFHSNWDMPLLVAPSLIVTDEEIDRFFEAFDATLSLGKYHLIMKFARFKFLGK